MLQKVVLLGVMGMFNYYFPDLRPLADAVNVLITVFVIVVLVKIRPSKTEEYNTANIFSQTVLLRVLLRTLMVCTHPACTKTTGNTAGYSGDVLASHPCFTAAVRSW